MKVSAVSFKSGYLDGKKEFDKLSDTQKAVRLGIEEFRQNQSAPYPRIQPDNTPLGNYVRYSVMVKRALKETLKKFRFPKIG